MELRFEAVSADRWNDFETLFGPQGGFSNCWCVALRVPHAERIAMTPLERKAHIHDRIAAGPPPGILAYDGDVPVGWVQVGPRLDVPQFNSPRTVARPLAEDEAKDPSVWAISCLLLTSKLRGSGRSHRLVAAAI